MTHPPLEEVLTSRSARQAYREAGKALSEGGWCPALDVLTLAVRRQQRADGHNWIITGRSQ